MEIKTKKGKVLVCQDRSCGYRKNVSKVTNARCPKCKKRLEMKGEGDGATFVCRCGYREKLSAFNERKKKEKKKNVSKKDVRNYMKKQQTEQDGPFNNALAEQLAKLKNKK